MVRTPNSPAWDSGSTLGQRTKTHIPHSVPPKFEKLKKKQTVTAIGGKEKRDPLRPGVGRKVFTEEAEG